MSLENTSYFETRGLRENELPKNHLEGIDASRLEGMQETEKNRLIGEYYFREEVETAPGLLEAFQDVSAKGSQEEFASLYERYVDDSRAMEADNPEAYAFFRDRIFYGREYGLNGLERFMRATDPNRMEQVEDTKVQTDAAADDALLSRMELHHAEITNCDKPYTHGDIMQMSRKMDFVQGDTAMLPIAADRMVAARNLMALCGQSFSEADVLVHTVDNEMVEYDPLFLKGFYHESNELYLSMIIKGMSGVEIYKPEIEKAADPAEAMADLLDRGHRGMVTYNPALLNRTDLEAASLKGKLLEKFPHAANETSALLCAVRDGNTNKVAGFMICDSARNVAARYVEADRLMQAMNVKHGEALFTKNPYPDN